MQSKLNLNRWPESRSCLGCVYSIRATEGGLIAYLCEKKITLAPESVLCNEREPEYEIEEFLPNDPINW